MKISYLFSFFEKDNPQDSFNKFLESQFFLSHERDKVFLYVEGKNYNNVEYAKQLQAKYEFIFLKIFEQPFNYNDTFKDCLKDTNCDILLLGDSKTPNIEVIFEKCLEKKQKDIHIIFVNKKYKNKIKSFFVDFIQKCYNFFIKLFTGKRDRCNILTLGLLDKDVIDILKVLPNKSCFLKNTKDMFGIESRTIYIPEEVPTTKTNFRRLTPSLMTVFVSTGLFFVDILILVLLNIFVKTNLSLLNIFFGLLLFAFATTATICLPKHFFDCRNKALNKFFEKEVQKDLTKMDDEDIIRLLNKEEKK